ncbi:DUF2799 domain-containing protein [Rhizobium vallis]|uniref:DUF2799 domain-containing protein n=1 Tax=Rhizobium vallis TaxID=634290 RepID=UPI0013DF471F|nr:DUF2799 domain-containing protein [Rhizobium vallis]
MRVFFVLAAVGIGLFLASCNTLSKKECLAGDWDGIGFTDGFYGHSPEARFEQHIKSCKRVKVVPDRAVWKKGYQAGLLRYCTPEQGLWWGQRGYAYVGVCPPETEPGFLHGHDLGRRQYWLETDLKRVTDEVKSKEEELEDLSRKLDEAPEAEKSDIRSDIHNLEWELGRVRDKQRDVESELDTTKAAVTRFLSQL